MHRFAIGGAWLFIVVSLLTLAGAFIALTSGVQSVALLNVSAGGQMHTAPGLTYSGAAGGMLIFFEAAVVVAATVATFFKRDKHRRIGHIALIAWAALWLFSSYSLASIDGEIDILAQSLMMSVLGTCTVYRAYRGWNTPAQLPSFRRTIVDEYQPEIVAESLPSVDAAIPQDEYGIASDIAPCDQSRSTETQSSLNDRMQGAVQAASRGVQTAWDWSKSVGRKMADLAAPAWRSSLVYLRSHGVLPRHSNSTKATGA